MFIEPAGGLANRLRALDSAIAYKKKQNIRLYVLWIRNKDCNCKFGQLFELPNEIDRLFEMKSGAVSAILRKILKIFFSLPPNVYLNNAIINRMKQKNGSAFSSISSILNNLSSNSSVYLQTYYHFYETQSYVKFSAFVPIEELRKKLGKKDLQNKIGVHIRRSDNHKSIENSPVESFIEIMRIEVTKDDEVNFFIASDDPEVINCLCNVFPGRVSTNQIRSLDRNNQAAIQDALLDLYCLANCKKLIGSYWSSFSDVAAEIRNIEKIIPTRRISPHPVSPSGRK